MSSRLHSRGALSLNSENELIMEHVLEHLNLKILGSAHATELQRAHEHSNSGKKKIYTVLTGPPHRPMDQTTDFYT